MMLMNPTNEEKYNLPTYSEFPDFALYMNQVVELESNLLRDFYPIEKEYFTANMVNNYVKQKILPPPTAKTYTRDHLVRLYMIFILKKVFNVTEVGHLVRYLEKWDVETAYSNHFRQLFYAISENPSYVSEPEDEMLKRALLSVSFRLKAEKELYAWSTLHPVPVFDEKAKKQEEKTRKEQEEKAKKEEKKARKEEEKRKQKEQNKEQKEQKEAKEMKKE